MSYRTKIYNKLNEYFMKPIMSFVGLSLADDKYCGFVSDKESYTTTIVVY